MMARASWLAILLCSRVIGCKKAGRVGTLGSGVRKRQGLRGCQCVTGPRL